MKTKIILPIILFLGLEFKNYNKRQVSRDDVTYVKEKKGCGCNSKINISLINSSDSETQ